MENINTYTTDNDFLLELEGLFDTPKNEDISKYAININEEIEVLHSDNLGDILSEIHEEVKFNESITCL
jgi:hypothetical protein